MRADSVGPILVPVVTALVMSALLRSAWRPVPPSADGSMRLRYGRGMTALAVCMLLCAVFFAGVALVTPPRDRGEVVALVGLLVAFGFGGTYFLAEARTAGVHVTNHGLVATGAWRSPRSLAWKDVARVHFSRGWGYLVLAGRDGRKLRVSPMLNGFVPFLDVLVERLGPELSGQAVKEAREYTARLSGTEAPTPPPRR